MTSIPPSLPPAPQPATPPQAPVTATPTQELPPQVVALPPNSIIDATVAATNAAAATAQARAVVQLLTELGTITARLPVALPPNATVKLQVLGSGAALQLRVIAINGQALQNAIAPGIADGARASLPPLAGPLNPTAAAPAAAGQQGSGVAQNAGPQLPPLAGPLRGPLDTEAVIGATTGTPLNAANSGITATVVFGTQPELPSGTQLILRLLNIAPPSPGEPPPGAASSPAEMGTPPLPPSAGDPRGAPPGTATPASTTVSTPTASDPTAGTSTALPSTTPPTPAPTGAAPQAPNAPNLAAPASDVPALPATLTGVVAANSLGGQPLIQTPLGLVSLANAPDFQPGARLLLETVGPPVLPAPADINGAPHLDAQPTGWSNFGEAMTVLQKTDPAAAQMLVARLPDVGPQFVSNVIGWVAAVQSGDVRAWLGERTVKALEKAGRADMIDKLENDLDGMRAPAALPGLGNDWQALTLPMFFGTQIERVRILVRRPPDEDRAGDERDEEGVRFLVDVDLSRIGPLQLDGLVKRHAKRFDLILRSRRGLSEAMRRDIDVIFVRALEGLGMTGATVFKQAVAFVEPLPNRPRGAGLTI